MHVSTPSVNPSGIGPGAQQSLATTLQEGVRISSKFTRKDKEAFLYFGVITEG